jgi:hypothetical protein
MPPLPGFRLSPGRLPAVQAGGIRSRVTGWWDMARLAGGPAAAMLAVAALVLPAVLLTSQGAALAAAAAAGQAASGQAASGRAQAGQQQSPAPVSIAITGMTPQWAVPGSTIKVSGSLRNTSRQPESHLTVQLFGSVSPVSSLAVLQEDVSQPYSPADAALSDASWHLPGQLAAGASANWSIHVPGSVLGMTAFGVYPLAAQAQTAVGTPLATTTTYLPYEPAKKGAYAGTRPAPAQIAWVWPLIDTPLLNEPWQSDCAGPQASALAQSLSSGGRLSGLLEAGRTVAGHNITWAVDPALLANVRALTTCHSSEPRWARAASAWLTELQAATAGQPVFATPYGDPNAVALADAGHGGDVRLSFQLGRDLAGRILRRSMSPAGTAGTPPALTQAAGMAWPAGGVPGYPALENLAIVDGVGTLLLSSSAFPAGQPTVTRTLDGGGSYMNLLLASDSITRLLGSAGSAPGSGFAAGQQLLAETALLAGQGSPEPIIAAPPHRWDPPAGLAASLLAATALAPWLSSVSLPSLSSARNIQAGAAPAGSVGKPSVSRSQLRKLTALSGLIAQLESIRAQPDADLYFALFAVESSVWQGKSKATARAMLAALTHRIAREQQSVRIFAESRITLGGLKGSVPVSIDNSLGYAIKVKLQLQYSQASGVRIAPDPQGLVTVPMHTAETIRLHVQAQEVGSTTVTMGLVSGSGQPLSAVTSRMTIQATQVGVLGMIIFAAALGVFLIASAARAVRRGRPVPAPDQPVNDKAADDHGDEGGAGHAEPDTVMAERTELGTAGTPGP